MITHIHADPLPFSTWTDQPEFNRRVILSEESISESYGSIMLRNKWLLYGWWNAQPGNGGGHGRYLFCDEDVPDYVDNTGAGDGSALGFETEIKL